MSYFNSRWYWHGDIVTDRKFGAGCRFLLRSWVWAQAWAGGSDFSREVLIPPVGWVAAIAKDASCAGRN